MKSYQIPKVILILVTFCIIPSNIIILPNSMIYAITSDDHIASMKTNYYSCEKQEIALHCDRAPNMLQSYAIIPTSSKIQPITDEQPTYVQGIPGKSIISYTEANLSRALEMNDYKREYVEFPNASNFKSSQFSVSFWIQQISDMTNAHGQIISHVNKDHTAGWFFDITATKNSSSSIANQNLRFVIFNNVQDMIRSIDIPVLPSRYVHIVGTFDGSVGKVYKDGILVDKFEFKGDYDPDPQVPIHIGSAAYCSSCDRWSGNIDETTFYNRVLAENEVKKIFLGRTLNDVSKGLVGYWKFDGNLNDISGSNNNGLMFTPLASMAFAPDGRLFFTEKDTGMIRIMMRSHSVLEKPFAMISDIYVNWEQGLLGLTVDPNFVKNHYIYTYYTALDKQTNTPFNRVIRFTDNNNTATNRVILLDNIPAEQGYHSGGALAFGPDDKLYITVGDATEHEFSQDPNILLGKVLRINRDGTIPQDNPFPNSPVYTLGHRNMFGIAFDRDSNFGIVTENGDVLYDELNLIQKRGNYGFPFYQPANIAPELSNSSSSIKPLRSYWQTIAPTQAIYYNADKFPTLKDKFLFGTFAGQIYAVHINNGKDGRKQIVEDEQHIAINHYPFEPVIGIAQSPDGDIYYGSYYIYKLDSLNSDRKRQETFPIEVTSSQDVAINDLQASNLKKYVSLALDRDMNTNNRSNISSVEPFVNIKIPRGIVNTVSEMAAYSINQATGQSEKEPIRFTLDNSSLPLGYNIIKTQLIKNTPHLNIVVNGTTTQPQQLRP